MHIKVKMNGNGARLARYLTTEKDGEKATLHELRGFGTNDLMTAFRSIQLLASVTQCTKPFDHTMVRNPDADRRLTREEWLHIADRIQTRRGYAGQPVGIFFHEKDGHEHMHLVFSRIDENSMTSIKEGLSHFQVKEEARKLEIEMGLTIVKNERSPEQGPSPKAWESEQARRLKIDRDEVVARAREALARADNGRALDHGLAERNLVLARGGSAPIVVVDEKTGVHSLPKLLGMKTKELMTRFPDVVPAHLPSFEKAIEAVRERQADLERRKQEPDRAALRARAQTLAAEDAHDARHFYTFSKEEQAAVQAKADAARARKQEERAAPPAAPQPVHVQDPQEAMRALADAIARRNAGTMAKLDERLQREAVAVVPPIHDREAETVRQTTALIDGAHKAAPDIVRREDARDELRSLQTAAARDIVAPAPAPATDPTRSGEAQAERAAERQAHIERAVAARDALESADAIGFQNAQREHRVVIAHAGGAFVAMTSRLGIQLTEEQGYKALEHINAERDSISEASLRDHLKANWGVVNASATAPPPLRHINRFDLPDLEAAQRMAYGMDRQHELARTVTEAFGQTARAQDGGRAFEQQLRAHGIELKRDRAERLHIVAEGRAQALDQFIPDIEQVKHLSTLAPRPPAPAPEFVSRADREDRYAATMRRIDDEKFTREVVQIAREPVRAVEWMTAKAAAPVRVLVPVVGVASAGLGFVVRSVMDLATGFGKFAEQERSAREPLPLLEPPPQPSFVLRERALIRKAELVPGTQTEREKLETHKLELNPEQQAALRRQREAQERDRGDR